MRLGPHVQQRVGRRGLFLVVVLVVLVVLVVVGVVPLGCISVDRELCSSERREERRNYTVTTKEVERREKGCGGYLTTSRVLDDDLEHRSARYTTTYVTTQV